MEKRIKILYIITIIAILAFLGMQIFWLYIRYEYSLKEHENALIEQILKCVDDYNVIRESSSDRKTAELNSMDSSSTITIPKFTLQQKTGDSITTTRTAKISTYLFNAHELLGLEPGSPLSEEQKNRVMDMVQTQMAMPTDSMIFDASGAKNENEAWSATRNIHTQRKCPFTTEGIDSILNLAGIKAQTSLVLADSIVWNTTIDYHTSPLSPKISINIPYSQLEGLTVSIVCAINPLEILPGIWQTLIITIVISTLLILCLILQISTVLKLSRIDKLRNSFITTMIHELKRPISTLKICVSGLENEHMMNNQKIKTELLSETRNALDCLSAYFSKLRDITFNNVEQIPLNLININVHNLFDSVANAIIQHTHKTVFINNNIDKDLEISADYSHFSNILNNIIENAIKYSGASVKINASSIDDGDFVDIHISDNGNGIPSNDIRHIFTRFYRGKAASGDQPGMGLGLTYVKLLIEAHGGDITVKSNEGVGSCFTIRLPQ